MSIRRIDVGPRMSQAVIRNDTIYLSGMVGEGDSVAAQARDILASVDTLLARAGSDKSKLLQAVIWLTDISTFAEMNSVWEAWIDKAKSAGARHRRGEARRAEVQDRDHGHRRGRLGRSRNRRQGTPARAALPGPGREKKACIPPRILERPSSKA